MARSGTIGFLLHACALLAGVGYGPSVLAIPSCPAALGTMVDEMVAAGPVALVDDDALHGDYAVPSQSVVDAFASGVMQALSGDSSALDSLLPGLGLAHCETEIVGGSGAGWVDVIYPPDGFDAMTSRGMPLLAMRRTFSTVPVVLGVPHAATEYRIAGQGVSVFEQVPQVALLVMAPQHRCHLAEAAPAAFQGSTTECDGVYRQSDAAHTQQSLFHAAHRGAWTAWPQAVTLQIHGMSADGISVSPGMKGHVEPAQDWPATRFHDRYAAGLEAVGWLPSVLTTCADYDGPRGGRVREHLCGTRNAQRGGLVDLGREQRFIHLEQVKAIRADPLNDAVLAEALIQTAGALWRDGFE